MTRGGKKSFWLSRALTQSQLSLVPTALPTASNLISLRLKVLPYKTEGTGGTNVEGF